MSNCELRGRTNGWVNPSHLHRGEADVCVRHCLLELFKLTVKELTGTRKHWTHLVDVFEFIYDLTDDWFRGLVAPGL